MNEFQLIAEDELLYRYHTYYHRELARFQAIFVSAM